MTPRTPRSEQARAVGDHSLDVQHSKRRTPAATRAAPPIRPTTQGTGPNGAVSNTLLPSGLLIKGRLRVLVLVGAYGPKPLTRGEAGGGKLSRTHHQPIREIGGTGPPGLMRTLFEDPGRRLMEKIVADVMTREAVAHSPDQTIPQAAYLLGEHGIRRESRPRKQDPRRSSRNQTS